MQQDTFISFDNSQQASFISVNEGRTGQGVLEIAQPGQSTGKMINRSLIEKLLKKQLSDDDKQAVIEHADNFNTSLDAVKICDPAIGSGAFPMGLLQEIFTAKQTIHNFMLGDLNSFEPAKVKLNIIQNSIYGVDIERGAVDIARLRFWLSLVVDEPAPQALPNLDYKIVVGNSLISKLGDDVIEIDWDIKPNNHGLFGAEEAKSIQTILKQLSSLQKDFFNPSTRKKDHATQIRNLKIELLINQLNLMIESQGLKQPPRKTATLSQKNFVAQTELYLQTQGWLSQISQLETLKTTPDAALAFFDWQLNFAEVMNKEVAEKVGFDIVIGNPPYINVENLDPTTKKYLFERYKHIQGRADIYVGFIERCTSILKSKGILSFIIPYAFTNQNYAEAMRNYLINNTFISKLVDLTSFMVFDSATVKNIILSVQQIIPNDKRTQIVKLNSISDFETSNFKISYLNQNNFLLLNKCRLETKEIFHLLPLKNRIDEISINFESIYLVAYGARLNNKVNGGKKDTYVSDSPLPSYKPFVEGKDINRYKHKQTGWLNYQPREHYNSMFKELFENIKIMFINVVSDQLRFTIDADGLYNSHTVINCVRADLLVNAEHTTAKSCVQNTDLNLSKMYEHKFVLSLLNSNLINWYFRNFQSEGLHFYPDDAKKLPIIKLDRHAVNQAVFIQIVDQILESKIENKSTEHLEQQLDKMVYKLYNLKFDEVKLIDSKFALSEAEYNAIVI
ncbi:MAG: hypothetical protein A3I83_09655 [Methylotenera sp. RIFCSPLOWO2_02_FULL_45_14]|nr:MAG: hypothetical protein A3I83_09655 [Methylotenera sp. RIFCSPLOWO2_02_FULL_45_14]